MAAAEQMKIQHTATATNTILYGVCISSYEESTKCHDYPTKQPSCDTFFIDLKNCLNDTYCVVVSYKKTTLKIGCFFLYADEFERIQGQRYLFRDVYRQRPYAEFELILHRDNKGTPWINDLEFLSQYRMKRTDFDL